MKNLTCWIILILYFISVRAIAQPGDPGGNPDVPISGIELLLLGGGLFGVKKLLDQKNKVGRKD